MPSPRLPRRGRRANGPALEETRTLRMHEAPTRLRRAAASMRPGARASAREAGGSMSAVRSLGARLRGLWPTASLRAYLTGITLIATLPVVALMAYKILDDVLT